MDSVRHFDIPVTDPAKSSKFYTDLFGWDIKEIPGSNYWMIYTTQTDMKTQQPTGLGINGGMGKRENAGGLTQPYFTVEVPDIGTALAKVEKGGGKIVRPLTDLGEWGKMAVFSDPDGNVIGLHQATWQK